MAVENKAKQYSQQAMDRLQTYQEIFSFRGGTPDRVPRDPSLYHMPDVVLRGLATPEQANRERQDTRVVQNPTAEFIFKSLSKRDPSIPLTREDRVGMTLAPLDEAGNTIHDPEVVIMKSDGTIVNATTGPEPRSLTEIFVEQATASGLELYLRKPTEDK